MDGTASPPASAEEESSSGVADLDPRRPAAAAVAVLEEGQGYVESLLRTSLQLLRKGLPSGIRRQGLTLMMHLLTYRWDELHIDEWRASDDIAVLVAGLSGTTYILPSKNAIATLMAEAILKGGVSLLIDLLPSIGILANRGPSEAELAAFILKWISDFRIVCTVDLKGGQSEAILSGLDEALPHILLLLSSLLEKYGGSVLDKHPEQLAVSSKNHGLTVAGCLLAANAYAEWVPVVHLAKFGLIDRCKSLLNLSNPYVLALRFFKVICLRTRPLYATEDYNTTMSLIFWILMNISKDSLTKSKTYSGQLDESLLEFAGRICECLVAMGSFNMQFIIQDGNRATHFFRQMLEYYQHDKIALHFRCLQFWLMVLMDLPKEKYAAPYPVAVAPVVNPASLTNSTKKGNCCALFFLSDDICDGMLDISFKRILKKSAATSPEWLELWSDELHGENGFIQYRSLLLDVIRCIAYERPIIAASKTVQRISCIIGDVSAITKDPKDLAAVDSALLGLETVVHAIFDDATTIILETEPPMQRICKIFEGLLVQLISLSWTEPELVVFLGRYLDALCPFLRLTAAVAIVVIKLLELISSINVDYHDPSKAYRARLQICSCVIHISQAVDGTSLPSDLKDLFTVPHITEEDVLAFVETNRTVYSVEQKHGTKFQNGNEAECLNLIPEYQISTCVTVGSTEFVDERNLGIVGTMSCHQEKGQLLLVEHNILAEAFSSVASFPKIQDMQHLLTDILNILNKIWTQSEWEDKYMRYTYCLSGLLGNDQFRRTVCLLVKSFEKLVSDRILESAGALEVPSVSADCVYSSTLPKLMLPLVLRVLNCIQMFWREPISFDLSGVKAKDIKFILENGKLPDSDEAEMLQSAETWSKEIRETGYNVIGLCASVQGAFYGLLDRSSTINVLTENLGSMEFNHLGKLIQLVIIPLVKYCPRDCWDEWMVRLLEPVFSYCEEVLYYAWFTFLHEGRAKIQAYFGNPSGPEEIVNQYEKETLLKCTRSISDLLGVLASERLNSGLSLLNYRKTSTMAGVQDFKSISSNSIIGYLLLHNCFGRLSMYLFGCLVDHQSAENALPFCYHLIHMARATNHERLKQFILNEMLPTIILLLGVDVKSAISQLYCSLNSTTKEDAMNNITHLCLEIYEVYMDNQVTEGDEVSDRFKDWLDKKLEYLRICASYAAPEDFPKDVVWNWELNEEFERFLPTYINLLQEVDAMDDCLEDNYLEEEILLEKLRPEFKSRYGIDSYMHPYLHTLSCMLQRKMPAVYNWKCTKLISQWLERLITLKPYVKCTDSWDSVLKRFLPTCEPQYDIWNCNPAKAVSIFHGSILFYWEPQFHPLIREGHKELLKTIAHQLTLADKNIVCEPLAPHPDDFPEHLQPYACMYIKRKKEEFEFFTIEEQVQLHEEFDNHLASGILDHRMIALKDDFKSLVSDLANSSFGGTLNHELIAMSFKRRARIVEWKNQMSSYAECLKSVLENDEMKVELGNLMKILKEAGFFSVDDDRVDWDNKLFSDSIDQFNKIVFPGQCIDKCLVIRGIMDYQQMLQMKDIDWQDAFKMVVSNTNDSWEENLQEFWLTTRHYTHRYYDILAQPLKKVFLSGGAPKPDMVEMHCTSFHFAR